MRFLSPVGSNLRRPECVRATQAGDLYVSDARGGFSHIRPDGRQRLVVGQSADLSGPIVPNGIAVESDGSVLLAHLGATEGGVFRLTPEGELAPVLREVDGQDLPPTNYVTRDVRGQLWVTVSTRAMSPSDDYRPDACTGFIVLDDGSGPRIVADGLAYTNECALSPDGAWLYVNETFGRCVSRFPVRGSSLGEREVVAELGPGGFPDGLAFDVNGQLWVTCVVSDRVIRIDREGLARTVIEATCPDHIAAAERAFLAGQLTRGHLVDRRHSWLGGCSSITFTGPAAQTVVLGSLFNDRLARVHPDFGRSAV